MPKITSLSLSIALYLCLASNIAIAQNHQFWQNIHEKSIQSAENRRIFPEKYRLVSLDFDSFIGAFSSIPKGDSYQAKNSDFILTLPLPDGTWQNF
ncbi:MAG: hypothetical protein SFU25_07225, partial [Candidatus Caenarcaniphilales bacterium]|nr:hypothetical protein [Candidatus Caenarcaniphilales bacterium]